VHLTVSWTTITQLTKLKALEYNTYEVIYTKHKYGEEKKTYTKTIWFSRVQRPVNRQIGLDLSISAHCVHQLAHTVIMMSAWNCSRLLYVCDVAAAAFY